MSQDNNNNISTEAYLDVLAAKIVAETKNAVNDGIKEAMTEHRLEHQIFLKEHFEPLVRKVTGLKNRQMFRDGATMTSLASSFIAHIKHLF